MATHLIRGLQSISSAWRGAVVTIGNFDGVHLGHQALLARVKERAKALNAPAVVITFEPQPAEFFRGDKAAVPRLTRWREKFHALAACDMDAVLVLRFDGQLASWDAGQFVQRVLCDGLAVREVIVGDDFRFGRARQGDFDFLQTVGQERGFQVEAMPSIRVAGVRVSSTRIRELLQQNDLAAVKTLLGRPYSMEGRIVSGDKRGRTIGFPTANISLHRQATPVRGVYCVRVHGLGPDSLPGVANVGTRPTVDGMRSLLEVHLFDFNDDIYKRHVTVEFCEKLRDEQRFESLDLLKAQIWQDAKAARHYFQLNESI